MARIFWVTCPKCSGKFYCHYGDFRFTNHKMLCPYCSERFHREDSPQIEE